MLGAWSGVRKVIKFLTPNRMLWVLKPGKNSELSVQRIGFYPTQKWPGTVVLHLYSLSSAAVGNWWSEEPWVSMRSERFATAGLVPATRDEKFE